MQLSSYQQLFLCICVSACGVKDESKEVNKSLRDTLVKPSLIQENKREINTDTLVVTQMAAVFYEPDSLQMEARKKEVGEEDFYIGADDYLFYFNTAHEYLQKTGLPLLRAQNKKYLKFVGANSQVNLIRLDTLPELWGIFFFQPAKALESVEMTMIEEAYKAYY